MEKQAARIKMKYASSKPGNVNNAVYFYYDTVPSEHRSLAIICGGYEECAPDYAIKRSKYPYFFVKYTLSGNGILHIKSKELPLEAGVLTGFEPGVAHHYIADPNKPMKHIFFTLVGYECQGLFDKSSLSEKHYIKVAEPPEVLNLVNKIFLLGQEKGDFSQDICCAYLRILLLEQAAHVRHSKANFPISKATYQGCKKYIDEHFSSLKSPHEVADACNIDVRYLSVLFKRYCHIPPSQYIMRLKLNRAANLLLMTDSSVKEISFKVGFEDPYHFSKNFKRMHGLSPSNYREKHI